MFYKIEEIEEEEEEDESNDGEAESSEAEDFDFSWMKPFADVLISKFEDYYDPDDARLVRSDLRNYFPECDEEQIADIFEFFEEENGFDTADGDGENEWVSVTQLMSLLHESQKEPGDIGDVDRV